MHTGVDLGGSYGNPIVAAAAGTVILVNNPREGSNKGGSGYGNYIIIDHGGGVSTLYAHLKNTHVKVGSTVKAGDRIASCGSTGTSTGPHLHFEVRINGRHTNPVPYIR
jgi:murein DD-endopeptidase MepM/ murein hydrolase activator NlpD